MLLIPLFLLLSIFFTMFGLGGGVVNTPFLLLYGYSFNEAATISLFLIMVTTFSGITVFVKQKMLDWKFIALMELFSMSGSFVGGFAAHYIHETAQTVLLISILFISGMTMILKPGYTASAASISPYSWLRNFAGLSYSIDLRKAVPGFFLAGLFSGILGVGGGVFKVPLMVLMLGIPAHIAFACSNLMVGMTAASGFAGRAMQFSISWPYLGLYAAATFIGASIGARIATKIDKITLKKGFGYFLILMGLLVAAQQFFQPAH